MRNWRRKGIDERERGADMMEQVPVLGKDSNERL
jgi:hypothetical protein